MPDQTTNCGVANLRTLVGCLEYSTSVQNKLPQMSKAFSEHENNRMATFECAKRNCSGFCAFVLFWSVKFTVLEVCFCLSQSQSWEG